MKITGDASSPSSAFCLPDAATSLMMTTDDDDLPLTDIVVAAPHPAIVAASPAVPDECISLLPPPPATPSFEEVEKTTTTKAAPALAPISPTGTDEPLDEAAQILDAIDLPDSSVVDLPFLTAGDDELGDFLVDWL